MSTAIAAPQSRRASPAARSWYRRCRLGCLVFLVFLLMTITAVVTLIVAVFTAFQARRFYAEVMVKGLARSILWIFGVKLVIHQTEPLGQRQVVYISNETSTLDVCVYPALGLPNTRFFQTRSARKYLPLALLGYLIGNFWTAPQTEPEKRVRIFQRAMRILQRTGASVYCSPEGMRNTSGRIGHFNKGAFHLATELHAPIVPFYIATPPEMDPGLGWDPRPGVVHVYFRRAIATDSWKLEDLDRNRCEVREMFVRLHEELGIRRS